MGTRVKAVLHILLIALMAAVLFSVMGFEVFGQESPAIVLDSSDAADAKLAWQELKAAEKKWAGVKQRIQQHYTCHDCGCKVIPCTCASKPGWEGGIKFSEDFRVILPEPSSITFKPIVACPGCFLSSGGSMVAK